MAPGGCHLTQGQKHERPPVHFRMGQLQLAAPSASVRVADLPAAEIQDVDVQWSRSPVAAKAASGLALDALQRPQKRCWRYRTLDHRHRVEVGRLESEPDRSCCV